MSRPSSPGVGAKSPAPLPPLSLTIAAVHWGTKYGPEYVYKLRDACALNAPAHRFVVLTEDASRFPDIETIQSPDPTAWGWWQKLALFKPGLVPGELILFLDLDSAVVALLDEVFETPVPVGGLVMVPSTVLGKAPSSPAMLWRPHKRLDALWDTYSKLGWRHCKSEWRGGDQRFITDIAKRVSIPILQFPLGMFHSYKEGLEGRYPRHSHAPVVMVYHGTPKPLDLPEGSKYRTIWETPTSFRQPIPSLPLLPSEPPKDILFEASPVTPSVAPKARKTPSRSRASRPSTKCASSSSPTPAKSSSEPSI